MIEPAQLDKLRQAYDPALAVGAAKAALAQADPDGAAYLGAFIEEMYKPEPLAPRDRERCMVVMLAARQESFTLAVHLYWGLMEGLELPEIRQTLVLAGGFTGISTYSMGLATLKKTAAALCAAADAGRTHPFQVLGCLQEAFPQ